MPSPMSPYSLDFRPFPSQMKGEESGDSHPAFTVFESFAKEETVVMVEARPHWEYADDGQPCAAIFDVVAAYTEEPDLSNPATSLSRVVCPHGSTRRFMVGIPGGHKLVVYPDDASRILTGAAHDSFLTATVVDYWA